jgi:hypothetical protein
MKTIKEQLALSKSPHGGGGGAGPPERLDKLSQRLLDRLVGIEHHLADGVYEATSLLVCALTVGNLSDD